MFQQQPSRLWFPTVCVLAATLVVLALLLGWSICNLHSLGQEPAKKKFKPETITEPMYMSRECPDDAEGSTGSPRNTWRVESVDSEKVVMACTYLVVDESKEKVAQ